MNNTFKYYNANPKEKCTDDCVIRAISAGEGKDYYIILDELVSYMKRTGYMINTPENYGKYLKDHGWIKQKQPKKSNGKTIKVGEFAQNFKGHAIIHAGKGHVSYIEENNLYDIWNCENEVLYSYWIPKNEVGVK